tara:strand:- start:1556 stop:1978 length:423 start_codon:yes stop_codon:yes gene_type:complete
MNLKINEKILIRSKELKYKAIKSTGPGGQNINKNSTAIALNFDISNSKSIPDRLKAKLLKTPNKYLTKSGMINIKVNTYKSQNKNKSEAILRLIQFFKNALKYKKKRIKTSPKKSSIEKRLNDKRKNSFKKSLRKKPEFE